MVFRVIKFTACLLATLVASTHAAPFQLMARFPNTTAATSTEPFATVLTESISGTLLTASFGETTASTPVTSAVTLSDGSTSTTTIPPGVPIWTIGGDLPPGAPTPVPPPAPPGAPIPSGIPLPTLPLPGPPPGLPTGPGIPFPTLPPPGPPPGGSGPGGGSGGGDPDPTDQPTSTPNTEPSSTGEPSSSSTSSETGLVSTLHPHQTKVLTDPASTSTEPASTSTEPASTSISQSPSPTPPPPPPPEPTLDSCEMSDSVFFWTFTIYRLDHWGGKDGIDLRNAVGGCGALTGWNWEVQGDGTASASFNLPFFIKAGCVEDSIADAGGPSGFQCNG